MGLTAAATTTHPLYALYRDTWEKLGEVVEGSGGFLDGTALVAHPREWVDHKSATPKTPTKKLKARRALARYENVARVLLDAYTGVLFRVPPVRAVGPDSATTPHPLAVWWDDVDGAGTPMDAWMQQAWRAAAAYGHVLALFDRPSATGPTAADSEAPFLRLYTPLDLIDWLTDDQGQLTAVCLLEVAPRENFKTLTTLARVREVRQDGWELRESGVVIESGTWDYDGRVPVEILYGQRRPLTPIIGQSILGDPKLYIDVYNLTSEIRELLRLQTFSILNVPLGTGADAITVEQAKAMSSDVVGTENAFFSGLPIDYVSPDSGQVEVYQAERETLLRTIYRLAGVPWEGDARQVESGDAQRVKRDEFYARCAAYAAECERFDYTMAEFWFRAEYGEAWERRYDDAQVTINYPRTFEPEGLETVLTSAQTALALQMPKAFVDKLKSALVPKLIPSLTPEDQQLINQAIEAMPDPEVERQQLRQAALDKVSGGAGAEEPDDAVPEREDEAEDDTEDEEGRPA